MSFERWVVDRSSAVDMKDVGREPRELDGDAMAIGPVFEADQSTGKSVDRLSGSRVDFIDQAVEFFYPPSLGLEEMQVSPADRQHLGAVLEVQVGLLVRPRCHVADGLQVHHHRAVHLLELRRVELLDQRLQ
jgi:hypothetical protein